MLRSWPTIHSTEEWADCWRRIEAPVLCLLASDPRQNSATLDPDAVRERARYLRQVTVRRLENTGHNIHHDAPGIVADLLGRFSENPSQPI
jgi:pimeloyl-ACP methyl ester carboxylesterase